MGWVGAMLLVVATDGCVVVVLVAGGDATMVRHMATDRPETRPDPWHHALRLYYCVTAPAQIGLRYRVNAVECQNEVPQSW